MRVCLLVCYMSQFISIKKLKVSSSSATVSVSSRMKATQFLNWEDGKRDSAFPFVLQPMKSEQVTTWEKKQDDLHPKKLKPYLTEKVKLLQTENVKNSLLESMSSVIYTKDHKILAI